MATVKQAYAPMDSADDAAKDNFYEQLQNVFDDVPNHELKVLIGDFNAQLSRDRRGLKSVIGAYMSSDHLSDNGEWLMSFCEHNGLCVGNTYFQHWRIHQNAWHSTDV